MREFFRHKFVVLLIALLTLLVVAPILLEGRTRLPFHILFTAVIALALRVLIRSGILKSWALVLGFPTLIATWTGYVQPNAHWSPLEASFHIASAIFFAATIAAVLSTVIRTSTVNVDAISGALCSYLLLALVFGHIYAAIELAIPDSFHGDEDWKGQTDTHRHFVLVYYSFITQSTVGYGDIVPTGPTARGFAMLQAVLGQFYIAVLVADLVGKRIAQAVTPTPPSSPEPPPQ